MLIRTVSISLAIPAYSRVSELNELLLSVEVQDLLPAEIIICEDCSPQRKEIRKLVLPFVSRLLLRGCTLIYIENTINLGYDGNVRKLLRESSQKWTMLIGNDDLTLPGCFQIAEKFLLRNPSVKVVSRSFVRFSTEINSSLGVSNIATSDKVFVAGVDKSRMLFRACGFVGGLLIDSYWAKILDTDQYDGTLYYQIYLAAQAFCEDGIGYISTPIVGGRAGNPPLFGSASSEKGIHVPGSYTPSGRAKMWQSVMEICRDVGEAKGINLIDDVKKELAIRQSFHVFEMMVNAEKKVLNELRCELKKIGLYSHLFPMILFWIIRLMGRRAKLFFDLVRKIEQ